MESDGSLLQSPDTSSTNLTVSESINIRRRNRTDKESRYKSEYGELDLDSIHLESNQLCEQVADGTGFVISKDAVFVELKQISLKLKSESKRLKDTEQILMRREKGIEKREDELNEFAVQLSEKEKRVMILEASMLHMKQNAEKTLQLKIAEAVALCKADLMRSIVSLEKDVKDKAGELKRLQGNFNLLKETCDRQRHKISDLESSNSHLQSQLLSANGRLKNLVNKKKISSCPKNDSSFCKQGKTNVSRGTNCNFQETSAFMISVQNVNRVLDIVGDQLDWLCDMEFVPFKDNQLPDYPKTMSRCVKMMTNIIKDMFLPGSPFHQALSCESCQSFVRFIYWVLYFHFKALSSSNLPTASLHRLCDVLFKGLEKFSSQPQDSNFESAENVEESEHMNHDNPTNVKQSYKLPSFFRESPSLRLYSLLVMIRICTDTCKFIKLIAFLRKELTQSSSLHVFIEVCAPMYMSSFLSSSKSSEFAAVLDLYVQLSLESSASDPSVMLPPEMDTLLVDKLSKLLHESTTDPQMVEKTMVVVQKVTKLRSLKKLFDQKNLTPQLQQLWLKANSDNAFLALSVRSVLSSIGASIPVLK